MIKKLHVFDFDGVLVNSSHRCRVSPDGKFDLAFWREKEYLSPYDTPIQHMVDQYRQGLENPEVFTVIATARVWNTWDFPLLREIGEPGHLISRKPGDERGGALLKILGLKKLLALKQFKNVQSMVMFEDNHNYLKTIVDYFKNQNMHGVYIPSNQGH